MHRQLKNLLKAIVRHQLLHLEVLGIPDECASVPRPVVERHLEYWRTNKYWFGQEPNSEPKELTPDQRMSLAGRVRFPASAGKCNSSDGASLRAAGRNRDSTTEIPRMVHL
jgi:hypothetical protein